MQNFTVELSSRAEKELRGLEKKIRLAVQEALLEMEYDPYAGDYKKLQGDKGHRRRIRDYRILFDIDTGFHLVIVRRICHRRDVYR